MEPASYISFALIELKSQADLKRLVYPFHDAVLGAPNPFEQPPSVDRSDLIQLRPLSAVSITTSGYYGNHSRANSRSR